MRLADRALGRAPRPAAQGVDRDEDRFVEAIRLSGRQPLDKAPADWELHQRSRVLAALADLEPIVDEELDDDLDEELDDDLDEELDDDLDEERQERLEAEVSAGPGERSRALGRQLVEDMPEDRAGERSALLMLVERTIGRLSGLASAHEARWEAGAGGRAERMTFDPGPEDELLWRYQFGCGRLMQRTLDTLLKLRREGRAAERAAGGREDRSAAPTAARDEATAQAVDPRVHEEPRREFVGCSVSTDPSAPVAPVLTEPPTGVPDCAPRTTSPTPEPDEASAPAVAPTPVLDEATDPAVAPSSLRDEASPPAVAPPSLRDEASPPVVARPCLQDVATTAVVARSSLQDEATAAAGPPLQNEATAPAGGSARKEPAGLVTAVALLALLSSAGLAAAFGRSTDVTPRPSPISAHEPRDPRTTHPGGDHQGPGKIPPESGIPTGREHRPCGSPAFRRSVGDDPTGHRASTIRDRSDPPGGIANPVRIPLRWQFSS